MSVEIINATSAPREGGPPSYYEKTRSYNKSAETLAKQKLFLEGYIKKGTLSGAARHAGIAVSNHHRWIEVDPAYPEQFQAALLEAKEALVEEGRRRALEGVEEPTGWYRGEPGGFVKRYSDSLLIFLIKGAFPDIYKDRHEHTGKDGGPIEVQSTVTIEQFPVWLKQAIVVCSTGIQIDPEVEKILQAHFEAKFLEAEKVVGKGTTGGQGESRRLEAYQGEAGSYHGDTEPTHGDAVVGRLIESVAEEGRSRLTGPEGLGGDSIEPVTELASVSGLDHSPSYRLNEQKQELKQKLQHQKASKKKGSSLSLDDI